MDNSTIKNAVIGVLGIAVVALMAMQFGLFGNSGNDDLRAQAANQHNPITSSSTTNVNGANITKTTSNVPPEVANAPKLPPTTMTFDNLKYEFEEVKAGEVVEHTYKFKNTGDEDLLISNAKGSCGCTVPTWPKNPIKPGESGEIVVKLNTKGKKNNVTQKVTLTANTTPAQTFLTIAGKVDGGAAAATPTVANPAAPTIKTK